MRFRAFSRAFLLSFVVAKIIASPIAARIRVITTKMMMASVIRISNRLALVLGQYAPKTMSQQISTQQLPYDLMGSSLKLTPFGGRFYRGVPPFFWVPSYL